MVQRSPYSPPNAPVADQTTDRPKLWARAVWLHFPVFLGCLWVMVDLRSDWLPEMTAVNVTLGFALTALLLYGSTKKLIALDETSPPWHWDVLLYSILLALIFAVVVEDGDATIVAGIPAVLLNGVAGAIVLVVEKWKGVKVYVSGRRYLFEAADDASSRNH